MGHYTGEVRSLMCKTCNCTRVHKIMEHEYTTETSDFWGNVTTHNHKEVSYECKVCQSVNYIDKYKNGYLQK